MKLLLLHLSFRGSLPTRQAVRETGRSCLLFSLCSNQTRRVELLYRSMLGVSGRLALAKKLMFWNASSKRKASSASGRGRVAGPKPLGRPSICKGEFWLGAAIRWEKTVANDGWRVARRRGIPCKLADVIGERCGKVHGEDHRRNLTDHSPSLPLSYVALSRTPHPPDSYK